MNPNGISIIIACFNSEKVIAETLKHVIAQKTRDIPWELILIDNNCSDKTVEIAEKTLESIPNYKIVKEPKAGLCFARIRGFQEAKYEILSFVDDDNRIPENWISFQFEKFKNREIGILGCTANEIIEGTPPLWFEKNKNSFATGKLYNAEFEDVTNHGVVYGAGLVMRKEIYSNLFSKNWKPYLTGRIGEKQMGGEDSELTLSARLLGYKIFYTNEISLGHQILPERLTWERLQKMTQGFGYADVFLLPYDIVYAEMKGNHSLKNNLRKTWWFNYIGKSIVRAKMNLFSGKYEKEDLELLNIRNKAFCSFLVENKIKFEASFVVIADTFMK